MTYLKKIIPWAKEGLKALIYGYLVFGLLAYVFYSLPIPIFFGAFIAYLIIGKKIIESKNDFFVLNFLIGNTIVSLIILIGAIIGFVLIPSLTIMTWPLLLVGVILLIISRYGIVSLRISRYFEASKNTNY